MHCAQPAVLFVDRLRAAGAVLIAKVATGEMAYDDIWWGGFVKNPWNIAEGSSGSSAGQLSQNRCCMQRSHMVNK